MGTSRTGSTKHKRFRRAVIYRDRNNGVTHCPICGVLLDYDHAQRPNSAEADHIIPARWGGADTTENGQTICRHCNQSKGAGRRERQQFFKAVKRTNTTDINW